MNSLDKDIVANKTRFNGLKKNLGYVLLGISDILNTTTPPGFELYIASEFSNIDNLGVIVNLTIKQIGNEAREALSGKLVGGIMREEGYKRGYDTVMEELIDS